VRFNRDAVQGKLPPEEAQGFLANAQSTVGAVTGTLGGTLKGVVDTTGNTVGSLAQGLQGTVRGVGDGLGSTVQFAGGAVSAGVGQVGNYVTGPNSKGDRPSDTRSAMSSEVSNTEAERERVERNILPDKYAGTKDASQKASESITEAKEKVS
jgi:hypothetical protein